MKNIIIITLLTTLAGCTPPTEDVSQTTSTEASSEIKSMYPATRKGTKVNTYFNTEISDPYHWLEDDRSEETAGWVKQQNDVTFSYLEKISYRDKLEKLISKHIDYERVSAPFKEGEYTYFTRNDGLQNQSVIYRQKGEGEPEVFLDPNTFSEDGTVSLAGTEFSEDGSLLAYLVSTGGSDWREVFVMDTETKQLLGDPVVDLKFSPISWYKNEGFYYSSYDKPEGSELSAKTDQHKVYYHKLGTPQSEDKKVFGHIDTEKHRYVGASVSDNGKYVIIEAANSTSGNKVFFKDITQQDSDFITIMDNFDSDTSYLTSEDDILYFVTNFDAPNQRLVAVDVKNPTPENWSDVIPHTENVAQISMAGEYLFANYMVDAISKVKQYDRKGTFIRDIALPGIGSANGFRSKKNQQDVYFSFENYVTPRSTYHIDLASGDVELHHAAQTVFNGADYKSEQVFYTSKDGTKVPMIITAHKDTQLTGNNPTILYGYGGFNVSQRPRYSSVVASWLDLGGVYAVANIRGGGEYGKAWHDAGTQLQKQNVFDDFIAAAEYLIDQKYTSKNYLALRGGSNGGLLVGAVMTQRPDLFKVALPAVGVLDMLRYHTFTAGAGWAYDYGTSEQSEEMFQYLLNYSPLHNVKEGVQYPATLITTADHDDRVVPAHSFKFAAELQSKHGGENPILIRIESDAGHGAGTPTSKIIEQYVDIYGFTLYNMGIEDIK
jgi:prolyl oligopeptidase